MAGLKKSIAESILKGRQSYGSMKELMDLISEASRNPATISLGGGVPGLVPPDFFRHVHARLQKNRELWSYLWNYTASEGILECRLAAALDVLDFCGYLNFKERFKGRFIEDDDLYGHYPYSNSEEARAELVAKLDSVAITLDEVQKIWDEKIGKRDNWGQVKEFDVSKYFYLFPGSTNALWDVINIIFKEVPGLSNSAVLAEPTYIGYLEPILDAGGKIEWVRYDEPYFERTGRYKPNLHQLREKLKHSKAFLFLSPCNPTGAIYDSETVVEIVDAVNDAEAVLISDDAYRHLTFNSEGTEEVHFAFKYITEHANNFVRTVSMSKEASSPGEPMAYLMTNIHELIEYYQEKISSHKLSISGSGQATMAAFFGYDLHRYGKKNFLTPNKSYYKYQKGYVEEDVRKKYKSRCIALLNQLKSQLGCEINADGFVEPNGALYAFPNFEKLMVRAYGLEFIADYNNIKKKCETLFETYDKKQKFVVGTAPCMKLFNSMKAKKVFVVLTPGILFGPSFGAHFRLTFATATEKKLQEAIKRLKDYIDAEEKERLKREMELQTE